ncbi:hypothetical protein E0H75_29635 [Kribbella capetownensis]|uniref:Lipoprotein n=1 Tax=Kribbella capetownensis TaxID=1572659 RepID=A0A4R0JLX6_9ACTN|nr:hypothetical protein [Kribbella capetownensis]TCC45876.1 hypothetical protein E0H75_29635 [Kribbella capetownensis]
MRRAAGSVMLLACGAMLTACGHEQAAPPPLGPPASIAGLVKSSDLPGAPQQEPLDADGVPPNGCTLGGAMGLQEHADQAQFVQYALGGGTVVKSFVYTYQDAALLTKDWNLLVSGNKNCVGRMTGPPNGGYGLLEDLPATLTGYETFLRTTTQVTHSERAWSRRGTDSIVSVLVTHTTTDLAADPVEALPADAKALTQKAAAE